MTVGAPYWVEVLTKGGREIIWTTLPDRQVGYFCLPGRIPVGRDIPITPGLEMEIGDWRWILDTGYWRWRLEIEIGDVSYVTGHRPGHFLGQETNIKSIEYKQDYVIYAEMAKNDHFDQKLWKTTNQAETNYFLIIPIPCLLYTSDAADE